MGRYATLVVDPPWPLKMVRRCQRRPQLAQQLPYPTMTLDEIHQFPLGRWAKPGAHVYLWTTIRHLPEAFRVLESWGVRYHLTLNWMKPSGLVPCRGYIFATEYCLLGFYGQAQHLPFCQVGRLNWFIHKNGHGQHSCKPDSFYQMVEQMSPGPRIDLFSRKDRPRWSAWGTEAGKFNRVEK